MTSLGEALPNSALVAAALGALGEAVVIVDESGRIVYANPMADRIVGVRSSDGLPDDWLGHYGLFDPEVTSRPFPPDQYPLVRALRGEETNEIEMLVRNPSIPQGAIISVTGRPVRDSEGRIIGAVAVFRDITRLRQAEMLTRLVPVCSWCKKVRDDTGYWQALETYIEQAQKARVTHGMCPACEASWEDKANRVGA